MSMSKKVVEHPVLTVIVFALLGIISLYSLTNISIDLFPDMENPVLMVSTSYPSAGPESVEKSVTAVLENALSGLNGLKAMTSTSSEGTSMIRLEFEYGTDLGDATSDIRDKVDRVENSLPDGVANPTIMKFDSNSQPILRYSISGNRPAEDLKEIAESYIIDRLQQADGVGQATASGGRAKIVRVEISQNRLESYGLTMTGVASALALQNLELGGGKIAEGSKNYIVRTVGEYRSIDEINDAIVASKDGYAVRVRDIGEAFAGFEDRTSAVYIDGKPGVYVSVTKQSGSNTVDVAKAVRAKVAEVQSLLPADVKMRLISDDSEEVQSTINSLLNSAWQGALLAMLILFLFLRSVRSTLIMGISIPFSILITLLCMRFAGITLNMMTMTGLILGVGMVVDASVVVLENIYQYRERGTKPTVAATLGTQEMFASVLSGNLTTVCVFIPIVFFQRDLGRIGQLLPDIIFTIIIALLSSLFVAMFLVPVLASRFLIVTPRSLKPIKNRALAAGDRAIGGAIDALSGLYRRGLSWVMSHRAVTCVAVVGMLALCLAFIPRLNIVMMPGMRDTSVSLSVALPIGTRLEETDAVVRQIETLAREEIVGFESITTSVGTGRSGNTYSGSISIRLPSDDPKADDSNAVRQKLRRHFNDYPNVKFSFSAGWNRQMNGADIDIALKADDLEVGLATARKIVAVIAEKVPDCSEASIDLTEGLPQVEVVIDRARAYSFGVNVNAVAKEIKACIDGVTATTYRSGGKQYSVKLFLRDSDRAKVPDLEKIFVTGSTGRVALANFASLRKGVGPVSINRENQARIIHITADNLAKTSAYMLEAAVKEAIDDSLILPEGVTLAYEGSWKETSKTGFVFFLIISMALLLVFGVMAGTYESFKDPFINLFTIPLGIIGVVVIYLLTGQSLSMFTAFGFVMLVGIAVNNGIILVDQTNLLVARGVPMHQACVDAGASRLRPVLMTTLTTLLGMFPMAFLPGEGNSLMLQPIGLCVFGGLASSTIITLFFIPVLYSIVNGKQYRKEREASAPCIERN